MSQNAEAGREEIGRAWFEYVTTQPRGPATSPMVQVASVEFCFADVWSRPGLDMRSRRMITLASLGFVGAEMPMRTHVYAALKSGDVSWEEMQEVVLHFSVYGGLPKASLLDQVAKECWARVEAEGGPVRLERPAQP